MLGESCALPVAVALGADIVDNGLLVNVLTVAFGVVLQGLYVVAVRYGRRNAWPGAVPLWQVVAVAGLLSLFTWLAQHAPVLPPPLAKNGVPVVGMLAVFCVSAAAMAVSTTGRPSSTKLLAAASCCLLTDVSGLVAMGTAELLALGENALLQHLAPPLLVWMMLLICFVAVLNEISLGLQRQQEDAP